MYNTRMNTIFNSFVKHPNNAHYDGEDRDEKILYVLRQSPIKNLGWICIGVVLLIIPFFADTIYETLLGNLVPAKVVFIVTLFWYLFSAGFIFQNLLNWFFNVYIISNKKIVDVDFHGILYKNISETPLRNVEDVTSTISGTLQVVFNYGTVVVQTSAEKREFEFENVSNPAKVRDLISDLVMEVRHRGH